MLPISSALRLHRAVQWHRFVTAWSSWCPQIRTRTHAHARAHRRTMLQVSNVAAEDEDDAKWRENCQRLLDLVPDERQSAALSMGPIRL